MSTRRSFINLAAVAIAATGLATAATVDPVLLALAPPPATVLSGLSVDQVKSSPFGLYLLSQMQITDADFQKFIVETGFDPRRDLSQVLSATWGDTTASKTVILGRGVFNAGRIANATQASGARLVNYKGVDLIVHDGSDMTGALAFLDATTAAMGQLDAVKAAIDRRGQSSPGLSSSVLARISTLAAANDAWFLSTVSPATFLSGKVDNPKAQPIIEAGMIQSVLAGSGGFKFTPEGATAMAQAITRSDKDASALADVFRFLVNVVQSGSASNADASKLASVLETLQITTQGAALNLALSIPEASLEQLFMSKHGMANRVAGAGRR